MMWLPILLTSAGTWLQKYLGHLLPESWMEGERTSRVLALLPIGLLAALTAVSTFTTESRVTVDARVAGLLAAAAALLLRAPFLLVLVVAAVTAAGLRYLGLAG